MTIVNQFDLSGKIAIVTGGNGGIGLAIAAGLACSGASIILAARNRSKAESALASLSASGHSSGFIQLDAGDPASAQAMIDEARTRFGRLDILVNNAGMNIRKLPQDLTDDDWRQVLGVNLGGAFFCARAAYALLKASGGGKIINIGSMYSMFGAPMVAAYAASKGGLVQLTKALACAWAPDNIQVNSILPGWIDTELTQSARQQIDGLNHTVISRTPAGRWGVPSDLAGAAVFLASEASGFITGAEIAVDGGYSARG